METGAAASVPHVRVSAEHTSRHIEAGIKPVTATRDKGQY